MRPDRTYHTHGQRILELCEKASIIACALRRPELVWASWWKRNKFRPNRSTGELEPIKDWDIAWSALAKIDASHEVHYLPIDHVSRDDRLASFKKEIGGSWDVDWTRRVGAFEDNKAHPPFGMPFKIDFSLSYSIPIVRELYT